MCKKLTCVGNFIYSQKIRISTLITFSLHIFDIVTDILVADELYREGSEYFPVCFGILIFSFVGSALLSLDNPLFTSMMSEKTIRKGIFAGIDSLYYLTSFIIWLLMDILQAIYILSSMLKIYENNDGNDFIDTNIIQKRINESLMESGPEALFQLFIILNQSSDKGNYELFVFYSSVLLSLLSLTYIIFKKKKNSLTYIFYSVYLPWPFCNRCYKNIVVINI